MKTSSGPDATPWKTSSLTLLGEAWILTVAPVFWPCNRTRRCRRKAGSQSSVGKGTVDPDLGAARVVFAQPLLEGEVLTGQQSICSLLGPPSPLPPPDLPYSVQRVIAKPAIQEPLHACERAVLVKGVAVGATVRMFRNDIESGSSCFDYPELWFRVADPLKKDEKVGFDQRFPDCELTGPPVHAKVGSAAAVPVPVVSRHAERSSHRPALQRRRADSSDRAVI